MPIILGTMKIIICYNEKDNIQATVVAKQARLLHYLKQTATAQTNENSNLQETSKKTYRPEADTLPNEAHSGFQNVNTDTEECLTGNRNPMSRHFTYPNTNDNSIIEETTKNQDAAFSSRVAKRYQVPPSLKIPHKKPMLQATTCLIITPQASKNNNDSEIAEHGHGTPLSTNTTSVLDDNETNKTDHCLCTPTNHASSLESNETAQSNEMTQSAITTHQPEWNQEYPTDSSQELLESNSALQSNDKAIHNPIT